MTTTPKLIRMEVEEQPKSYRWQPSYYDGFLFYSDETSHHVSLDELEFKTRSLEIKLREEGLSEKLISEVFDLVDLSNSYGYDAGVADC